MPLHDDTYRQQADLANYCRTNILADSLQVAKDRVTHYRRLVFNVINDSLQSAFPLAFNLLKEKEWDDMVHEFFSIHNNQSPQIWKMPKDFYLFWKDYDHPVIKTYPHLTDLLFFEWIEIELFMMEDKAMPHCSREGDILNGLLAFNPEHKFIHVRFPVHLKNALHIREEDAGDYYILVYRERETGKVQFIDLSPLYTLILENLVQGLSLQEILEELRNKFEVEATQEIQKNILELLDKLRKKEFFLGFLRT